jgi:hypothetical protein
VVADELDDGLTYVPNSANNGGAYGAIRTIFWDIPGGLEPGASMQLSYTARLNAAGNQRNNACVAAVDLADNHTHACASVIITSVVPGTSTPTPTLVPGVATPTPGLTPAAVAPGVTPTLTLFERSALYEAMNRAEAEEQGQGVVEKVPPDSDEPGAPPAQVPIQVPLPRPALPQRALVDTPP